ncbi:MAG: penicillin-binding transpeptidase domain-containing protein [Candidatus Hydrogenedentota bacterium]
MGADKVISKSGDTASLVVIKKRIKIVFITLIIFFIIVFIRIFYIQIAYKEKIFEYSSFDYIFKERGTIFDRNGQIFAISNPTLSLYANPSKIDKHSINKIAGDLARTLNIDKKIIQQKLSKKSKFVWIKRNISEKEANTIKQLNYTAIGFRKEHNRYYPFSCRASHILGFVGMDNRGLEGIELLFDDLLKGDINLFTNNSNETTENESISDLYLTIDNVIQGIAEEELKKSIIKHNAKEGIVIVSDPYTGEILAMTVYPDFDPNNINKTSQEYLRNRAITDIFEAGSIMKIFSMSYAIERNLVNEEEKINCTGGISIAGHNILCTHNHGALNLEGILQKSCNVGIISIAKRFNERDYYNFLRNLGFGEPTGCMLPGEQNGILHKPDKWSLLTKTQIAIGYGISVTPIQLVIASNVIANGGILYKPRLIKKIVKRKNNELFYVSNPEVVRSVLSSTTAYRMSQLLRSVITIDGTGYEARVSGFTVSGKTGTAKMVIEGEYAEDRYIGSFVGWVPADDPVLTILVVIKDPAEVGYYGGVIAAPVFSNIARRTLNYMKVYSTQDALLISRMTKDISSKTDPALKVITETAINKSDTELRMPHLKGLSLREAIEVLSLYKVKIQVQGSGRVSGQIPEKGAIIKKGQTVIVQLGY